MNDAINPKVAAETARETYRKTAAQFQEFAGNTEVPGAMRALVENNIAKTRELYERSKDALEALLESWEKSFDAVGQGAVALNRKVIDIAQRNINSSFDLAKSLAGAKNLAEAVELQGAYWRRQLDALAAQAEEVRTLSTQVTADAARPIKVRVKRHG
jgi:phasin